MNNSLPALEKMPDLQPSSWNVSAGLDREVAAVILVGPLHDSSVLHRPAERVQSKHANAAVQERAASRREVGRILEDHDAAIHRPGRFEPARVADQPPLRACR